MALPKKIILFCSLFAGLNSLVGQIPRHELIWAVFHPVAAVRVETIDKKCDRIFDTINTKRLDSYSNGGRLDAFRHVFYMAAFAQKINPRKLRKLGKAHEKTNYRQFKKSQNENGEIPDSLSSVMDLKNNELGFLLGKTHRNADLIVLKEHVIQQIQSGTAVIMQRNQSGKYLDCAGNVLIIQQKKWNIPKCLVSSR